MLIPMNYGNWNLSISYEAAMCRASILRAGLIIAGCQNLVEELNIALPLLQRRHAPKAAEAEPRHPVHIDRGVDDLGHHTALVLG
jgi:hypothetical protein